MSKHASRVRISAVAILVSFAHGDGTRTRLLLSSLSVSAGLFIPFKSKPRCCTTHDTRQPRSMRVTTGLTRILATSTQSFCGGILFRNSLEGSGGKFPVFHLRQRRGRSSGHREENKEVRAIFMQFCPLPRVRSLSLLDLSSGTQ